MHVFSQDELESLRDNQYTLLSEEEIRVNVANIADRLNQYYSSKKEIRESNPVLVIGLLKGSILFMSDIMRKFSFPLSIQFMEVKSYGNSLVSSGKVDVCRQVQESIHNRHVLLIEDIIDSGLTLNHVWDEISKEEPASLNVAALLYKKEKSKFKYSIEFTGTIIPDEYVFGYGMDYKGLYRNYASIQALRNT